MRRMGIPAWFFVSFLLISTSLAGVPGGIIPATNPALPAAFHFQEYRYPQPDDAKACAGTGNATATLGKIWFAQTHVMEPAWTMNFLKINIPSGPQGWAPVEDVMSYTLKTLEEGPYVLGMKFSAADVLLGTTFAMFMGSPSFPKTPLLEAYVERVVGRPAFARGMERAGGAPR